MSSSELERLRLAAFTAAGASAGLADEIDSIIDNSLASNASRALRSHLRVLANRQRDIASALSRELDHPDTDSEIVGLLTKAARKGAALFMAGVMFTGGGMATGALESLGEDAKDRISAHITAVESASEEVEDALVAIQSDSTPDSAAPTASATAIGELAFVLEIELLLREAVRDAAVAHYGPSWVKELSTRGLSPTARPDSNHWTLGDLVTVLAALQAEGAIDPDFLGFGTDQDQILSEIIQLRDEIAHGVPNPEYDEDTAIVGLARQVHLRLSID